MARPGESDLSHQDTSAGSSGAAGEEAIVPAKPEPDRQRRRNGLARQLVRRGVPLLAAGVSLYLLLPSLLAVFGSWRSLAHLAWPFALLTLASETASYVCMWELDRIALGTRAWFPVVTTQLSANAVGRILPGGGATFTTFASAMLARAGYDPGVAVGAFGASASLQLATTFVLPVLALPAVLGGAPVEHSLVVAAYLGLVVFALLLGCGIAAFGSDTPLDLLARGIEWVLNKTIRRKKHVTDLPQKFLTDRDAIRSALGQRWKAAALAAAGNTGFDYLALLFALRAVGAEPRPSLVILAYVAAELLALVPLTPGGLGFVEVGLAGMLVLAGVPGGKALTATLLYRIVFFWLPLPAGGIAYALFKRRYRGTS